MEGKSLLAGGLTIALMVLPIVIITTQEALRAVPAEHPRGRIRCRGDPMGGHPEPRAPERGAGHPHGLGAGHGPRAGRDRAPDHGRGRDGIPGHQGRDPGIAAAAFTALPTLIFAYVKKPQAEFQELAAAAILVLMTLIFLVNLTAILLEEPV